MSPEAFAYYLARRWGLLPTAARLSAEVILSGRPWRIAPNAPCICSLLDYMAFDDQFGIIAKFDPDQPRDEGGKWTSGGGDGGGGDDGGWDDVDWEEEQGT